MGRHSGNTRVAWLRRGLNLGLCLLGWGIGLATAATGAPLPDLGGDDPQVCARSADMRGALLDALTPVGGETPACEAVTGAQLAGIHELGAAPSEADMAVWDLVGRLTRPRQVGMYIIRRFTPDDGYDTLGLSAPVRVQSAQDLAGLTGLESLALRFEGQELPSDFLAPVPQLTHLELDTGHLTGLPSDFLAPVPQLTHLTLKLSKADLIGLPSDFLAPVPRLTHLNLLGVNATLLPSNFLDPVPRLTHLELHNGGPTAILETDTVPSAELPSDFLAPVPRLTRLELRGVTVVLLPPAFLAHVPALTHLELGRTVGRPLPSGFLAHVPNLTVLRFRYFGEEPDFLAPVPQLTHLYFVARSQEWPPPADFLVPVSRLTHLNMSLAHGMVLPPDFLAPVPALVHLRLYQSSGSWGSVEQNRLPSGFLDHTPQLAHLEIRGVEPTALPPGFLAPMPWLTHLILVGDDHLGTVHPEPENFPDTLSPGFLAPVPSLTHLELESQTLRVLPPDFLDHTPRLTRLYLRSDWFTHYPADFLVPVPHLTHLTLRCSATPRPMNFLVPVPQLTFLNLCTRDSLPAEFLVPVPHLTHLRLDTWGGGLLPPDILAPVPHLTHLVGNTPQSPNFAAHVPRLVYLDGFWSGDVPLPSLPSVTHLRLSLESTLSDGFLAHVPQLTHLRLSVDLQAFPPGFLAHVPRLQRFEALVWGLEELPSGFLAHAPRLTHFTVLVPPEVPVDTFKTVPTDFLAHAPSLKSLRLPYKLMRELQTRLPDPVWSQVREHGIDSLAIVTARHTAQLSFPSDANGIRHDILDGEHGGRECGYDWRWQIRTGAGTAAWLSSDEAREVRIHIQEAPRTGLRELQGQTDREAIRQIVAGTASRPGMLQGQPLYSRPSRQGRVIGYVPWGGGLRVTARHGEGADAWLHGVLTADDPSCAYSGWVPATAIWTVEDRGLERLVDYFWAG